ncbi:MAG: cytochrome P450 [Microthrixaceae bacterium]
MTATTTVGPPTYDPYAYEIHEDPYPTYERLRDEAPVYHNSERGFWALSRHEDVLEAFRNADVFSSAEGVSLDPSASGPHAHRTMSFLAMDEPMHGRMRGLVSRGFTPRRVAELEPRIREIARGYIAEAVEAGSFDFVDDFAGRLPMDVISELLGLPMGDRQELRRLSDLLVHREEGMHDVPPEGVEAAMILVGRYSDLLAQRRRSPGDDLVSALLAAEIDGDRLSDDEIIGFLFLMVVAGNETTTKLLGNAWWWAWKHPLQRRDVFGNATQGPNLQRVPAWVEETLRFDTSTQMLARVTTTDVELHGTVIPAGERVLLLIGSANRDPRAFGSPDSYDLGRVTTGEPMAGLASFGFGRHYCLGASLARLEARVALEELASAVSDYDIDPTGIKRVHSVNVRGFAKMPTTVTPRAGGSASGGVAVSGKVQGPGKAAGSVEAAGSVKAAGSVEAPRSGTDA